MKKPPKVKKIDGECWALAEKMYEKAPAYELSAYLPPLLDVAGTLMLFGSRKQAREWIKSQEIKHAIPVRIRMRLEPV